MHTEILPFAEAVNHYPDHGVVVYNRVSEWSQAGAGGMYLQEKTWPTVKTVCALTRRRFHLIIDGVEKGKLSKPRRTLVRAATEAKCHRCILVAAELSRFIRAEAYDRRTNINAWPTAAEFAQLHELTLGVPLATIESPYISESQRHSRATKRTGKAGRPSKLRGKSEAEIRALFGHPYLDRRGVLHFEGGSLREIAKRLGVNKSSVHRWLDWLSPHGIPWCEQFTKEARVE